MKPRLLAVLIAAGILGSAPASAGGGGGFAGATEMTQLMNNAQLAQQYMTQVQQYATQVQQTQMMINLTVSINAKHCR